MWMFSPVFSPGPTTMGCFRMTLMTPVLTELNTGGTTEEMMQSSISFIRTAEGIHHVFDLHAILVGGADGIGGNAGFEQNFVVFNYSR